jgi:redox-sensitive bicupin YhaK (pirin superfamily)
MTAGRGIAHSERADPALRARGQRMHGIQSWVALPAEAEETAPAFANHKAADLPTFQDRGVWARLIAGEAFGLRSAVQTHSPLFYLHADLAPGASLALPHDHAERAAYIVDGTVTHDSEAYAPGRLLVFAAGGSPALTTEQGARLILLGGAPIGMRYIWWNFVSSRRERLRDAVADWKAGRFALPPGDDREFIPAPDSPPLP